MLYNNYHNEKITNYTPQNNNEKPQLTDPNTQLGSDDQWN